MKHKWYRIGETDFEDGDYHIWGKKTGMHLAYFDKINKWVSDGMKISMEDFTHAKPFPLEPRRKEQGP